MFVVSGIERSVDVPFTRQSDGHVVDCTCCEHIRVVGSIVICSFGVEPQGIDRCHPLEHHRHRLLASRHRSQVTRENGERTQHTSRSFVHLLVFVVVA
jgi:hypothetical protein